MIHSFKKGEKNKTKKEKKKRTQSDLGKVLLKWVIRYMSDDTMIVLLLFHLSPSQLIRKKTSISSIIA